MEILRGKPQRCISHVRREHAGKNLYNWEGDVDNAFEEI
jgi:hypothetical protein